MNSDDFKKCIDFIIELDKLKNIFRRSLIIGSDRFENDAEHSWHICMMAYTLYPFFSKDRECPDISRAVKMLLLHDIVEIYAGDTYCYDTNGALDKKDREIEAADRIFGMLPKEIGGEYKALWQEFDDEQTTDAVFASIMDKVQPLLLNYNNAGKPWRDNGIKKSQVLNRMSLAIEEGGPLISGFVLEIINDAVSKGWLRDC